MTPVASDAAGQRGAPPPIALRRRIAGLDPRLVQIAFLAALLGTGVLTRDFSLRIEQMAACFAAGLATQAIGVHALGLRRVGYLSALVTCFGLSVLLRADSLWVHPLAAAVCLSAKFVLRVNGKHLFNPTNLGVVLALAVLPGAWVSPGQWGSDLAIACWAVVLGGIVARRARRLDIGLAFLGFYLLELALRVAWLGQSWNVFLHQLQSGALILFAFFMISDPMTIPSRGAARVVFAAGVALLAFVWQYVLYIPNALIWSLFLCAPLVPLLDRLLPGEMYTWRAR